MDWISLIAIGVSLLLVAFLAGIESAFISVNKLSIELARKQGTSSGRTWGYFAQKPTRFIVAILVGINLTLVVYGLFVGSLLLPIWKWIELRLPEAAADYLEFIQLFVEIVLATTIIIIVEFTSRAFFRARNNSMLRSGAVSGLARLLYWMFAGISSFFVNISGWLLQYVFNVKINEKKELFNKMDLEQFLQQSKSTDEEESTELNTELFENALSLSEVRLRECLIPRNEIEAVQISTSIDEVRKKFIDTKLSKLIVYGENLDNILGYIHQLDMFNHPSGIQEILLPIPTVPESMSATDLMNKFSRERKTIAWVIDEFGGTSGIVTMEDLLEEIFGDIHDEYDMPEEFVDKQISENEFIFSGRLELDHLVKKYDLEFPEDASVSLSGFIIQVNEGIPRQKDIVMTGNYEFTILNVSDTRIETVKLKVLK